MNELVNLLIQKVGIDQATAEKVVTFLKEHATELPKWLGSGAADAAKGALGNALGGILGKKP